MTAQQLGFDAIARERVLDRVLANSTDPWRNQAFRAVARIAGTGKVFQATDLLEFGATEPDHPNRWGGLLFAASKAGLIEHVGYAQSHRSTVQGSVTKTWRGTDVAPETDLTPDLDRLRALSVNRPYADQIMRGVKVVENRTKPTHYRGPLVIHASVRVRYDAVDEQQKLTGVGRTGFVGVVELVGVCSGHTGECRCGPGRIPGYFHWQLAHPRPFPRSIDGKGRLGLFPPPLAVSDIALRIAAHPEALS